MSQRFVVLERLCNMISSCWSHSQVRKHLYCSEGLEQTTSDADPSINEVISLRMLSSSSPRSTPFSLRGSSEQSQSGHMSSHHRHALICTLPEIIILQFSACWKPLKHRIHVFDWITTKKDATTLHPTAPSIYCVCPSGQGHPYQWTSG